MEKIPTAEEFFLKMYLPNASDEDRKSWLACNELAKDSIQIMIEFAKLHVEPALKAASENGQAKYDNVFEVYVSEVDKDSILNSYPLDKIK